MIGYLAAKGFERQLLLDLKDVLHVYGRLIVANGPLQKAYWAENVWLEPEVISFGSIAEAAGELCKRQALWTHLPYQNLRRAELIRQKLPYFSPKPLPFPAKIPEAPLGAWMLLGPHEMLLSSKTLSPVPHGEYRFQEDKEGPPSRAYLKLWEAFTRLGCHPKPADVCLDIGASPGSWTWALQRLGAKVLAFDRAPLESSISSLPGVQSAQKDAFSLHPRDFPEVSWVFSDVICYPGKLLSWVRLWLEAGFKGRFLCTIKLQGEEDYPILSEFASIEGSRLMHLSHNKHELTWHL